MKRKLSITLAAVGIFAGAATNGIIGGLEAPILQRSGLSTETTEAIALIAAPIMLLSSIAIGWFALYAVRRYNAELLTMLENDMEMPNERYVELR